jgi:hypothetical protein
MKEYAPGQQICRKKCPYMAYVEKRENLNYSFFRELGLSYEDVKGIIKENGGALGVCTFNPNVIVTLGITCQNPEEYIAAISLLN